jgi:hypothetical protein
VPSGTSMTPLLLADAEGTVLTGTVLSDRGATLAEFEDYLRTVNNRDGRPYEEKTISNYVGPGKNLDAWMTGSGLDGDFTILDVATLNRYFRDYYLEHGQGGTHTLQRNLIQLFNYLEHERGFASPYSGDALNRYTPVKGRPKNTASRAIPRSAPPSSSCQDIMKATATARHRQVPWKEPEDDRAVAACHHGDTPDNSGQLPQARQQRLNKKLRVTPRRACRPGGGIAGRSGTRRQAAQAAPCSSGSPCPGA